MSMFADIEEGTYKNKLPYPKAPEKPALLLKKAGDLTLAEIDSLKQVTEEYGLALAAYATAREEYNQEEQRLQTKFREDALEYAGLKDHPKANKAYWMAWERGHSGGLGDVLSELEDIADLLR